MYRIEVHANPGLTPSTQAAINFAEHKSLSVMLQKWTDFVTMLKGWEDVLIEPDKSIDLFFYYIEEDNEVHTLDHRYFMVVTMAIFTYAELLIHYNELSKQLRREILKSNYLQKSLAICKAKLEWHDKYYIDLTEFKDDVIEDLCECKELLTNL